MRIGHRRLGPAQGGDAAPPWTASSTSMLPRVAFEYGQPSCAFATSASARPARAAARRRPARTARPKRPPPIAPMPTLRGDRRAVEDGLVALAAGDAAHRVGEARRVAGGEQLLRVGAAPPGPPMRLGHAEVEVELAVVGPGVAVAALVGRGRDGGVEGLHRRARRLRPRRGGRSPRRGRPDPPGPGRLPRRAPSALGTSRARGTRAKAIPPCRTRTAAPGAARRRRGEGPPAGAARTSACATREPCLCSARERVALARAPARRPRGARRARARSASAGTAAGRGGSSWRT